MLFNSRSVAFIISLVVSGLTVFVLSFLPNITNAVLALAFIACFTFCAVLVYLMFEVLVFNEIKSIYADLEKIKKKEYKISKSKTWLRSMPLKKIKDELYLLEFKKQQEIDELKRLDSFRREFLADVSHELKTPVFAAQGFVHTLIDGAIDDPEVRDKFLEKAARSLDRLDIMVQDLIGISQLEKGIIKMHRIEFNIMRMVQEVFEQLEIKAASRNIKLHLQDTGYSKIDVLADPARIRQVITNLVDNAIKYGNEGGNIWVSFLTGKKKVQISVRDDGEGIPKEHQSRIFERFYRIDKSRSRENGGSGLGLAISKHITEAHNSKLIVNSTPGKGTTMKFKLPRAKGALPEPKKEDLTDTLRSLRDKKPKQEKQ
ncbi:MAG: two-component sensor histidine kinase [Chitinophagaceae bacterium]|nr:MAG: two-component sensor histidine kinase [Chitinophagaceae bacterium]